MGSNHDIDVYIPQEKANNTNYGSERLTFVTTMMKGQFYLLCQIKNHKEGQGLLQE